MLWLKDAVELKAKIIRLAFTVSHSPLYQVEAQFMYNGKKMTRKSSKGNIWTGSHNIFAKYHNKDVRILYSPTYDEVLLLKGDITKLSH